MELTSVNAFKVLILPRVLCSSGSLLALRTRAALSKARMNKQNPSTPKTNSLFKMLVRLSAAIELIGEKKKKKKNPLWQIKIRLFQRMRKEQAEETS